MEIYYIMLNYKTLFYNECLKLCFCLIKETSINYVFLDLQGLYNQVK